MSRRDFESLAAELLANRQPPSEAFEAYGQWTRDVECVANVCARSNPRFDRLRFYKACGV